MLAEHLSQDHDAASRRFETIDEHVRWVHHELLSEKAAHILDLACGPGLYTCRLARLGHRCCGIDYSPASIAYARAQAEEERLQCVYRLLDIRSVSYGSGYDLAMLLFGEFNVMRPRDGERILAETHAALGGGGRFLIEPHTFDAVKRTGERSPSWYTSRAGLFSSRPHLCLTESSWDDARRCATVRYFAIDAGTGRVERFAQSFKAYTDEEYRAVLTASGFEDVRFLDSLGATDDAYREDLHVIVAAKGGAS
jgi:SAM-dependent methyltransferase